MRVTTIFQLGYAVLSLFSIGILRSANAAYIPIFKAGEGKDFLIHNSGKKMPITRLQVQGELYPGGPSYFLEGHGLHSIEKQLIEHPMFNITAFKNTTLEFKDDSDNKLQKRDRQIYWCERKPRASEGMDPDDIKPAIDFLRRPPWSNAFCYAAPGSCALVTCHGGAAIFLCNHRPTMFRTTCGSAVGRISWHLWHRMDMDKRRHSVDWPANGDFPMCVGWYFDTFRYIAWSKWDTDISWEINILPYHGQPCKID
ncbi:hypothetical protein TWF481_011408 [Arthrobotrys musiformis]|uniref:Uncharacterized protein n=1 Tax=Arthrobotrys musiformis TaxID=47236 RepID=A0AAV9W034_9PEZI